MDVSLGGRKIEMKSYLKKSGELVDSYTIERDIKDLSGISDQGNCLTRIAAYWKPGSITHSLFPNPFIQGVSIPIHPGLIKSNVKIDIFNVTGVHVKRVSSGKGGLASNGHFFWDGTDQLGLPAGPGAYLVRYQNDHAHTGFHKVMKQ